MLLTSYKPVNYLFDNFWNASWPNGSAEQNVKNMPTSYVCEKDGKFTVEVELPGVKKEDIGVHVEAGVLSIKASRKRVETEVQFERSFRLADDLATDNISASHENGLLVLTISRKEEAAPKRIEVQ